MKLVGESLRSILSQPIASTVTGLIVAGVCATILSTTGQTVQAETQVLSRIDAAGTRSIIISDRDGTAGLHADAVDRLNRVSGIEWAFGLGPADDVRSVGNPGGNPAPIRVTYGTLPPQLTHTDADIGPDRALIGPMAQSTLGLQVPIGGVASDDSEYAVVAPFGAEDPLSFLNRSLIRRARPDETAMRSIHILANEPGQVPAVAEAAMLLLGPEDITGVSVQTSETLADVRAAVSGELGRFSRDLITLVLGAGLALTALNVYGSVNSRRRDLGRRRALGASRPTIVGLIALQTAIAATVGAAIGSLVTTTVFITALNDGVNLEFAAAIAVLAVLAATVAAIPPALIAAYRDPVRVLRVP